MKHLFSILIIFFALFSKGQVIEVAGTVESDTTWAVDTVLLVDDVYVPIGVKLTISPNTVIQGAYKKYLEVQGALIAVGTPDNPIIFTAKDTTGFRDSLSDLGSWGGIHLLNLNVHDDSTILDFCVVEYGGAFGEDVFDEENGRGGGIYITNSSNIRISNSIIQKNKAFNAGGGVFLHNESSPHIHNNIIRGNFVKRDGGGIMCRREHCAPLIEKNLFLHNYAFSIFEVDGHYFASGAGGGLAIESFSQDKHAGVYQNIFSNNYSVDGAFYESSWETKFISNIVCNNEFMAVVNGHQRSRSVYANNTIVNNYGFFGAAVVLYSDHLIFTNNIVHNNYRGFYNKRIANVPVENELQGNILSNNIGGIDEALGKNIRYNIDVPPLFVNPSEDIGLKSKGYLADWSLKKNDADIDAGTNSGGVLPLLPEQDAYGNKRIQGESVDMGAVEYNITDGIATEEIDTLNDINVYPNPFSNVIWMENVGQKLYSIGIYSVSGVEARSVSLKGNEIKQLVLGDLPKGLYIFEVKNDKGKILYAKKIVK